MIRYRRICSYCVLKVSLPYTICHKAPSSWIFNAGSSLARSHELEVRIELNSSSYQTSSFFVRPTWHYEEKKRLILGEIGLIECYVMRASAQVIERQPQQEFLHWLLKSEEVLERIWKMKCLNRIEHFVRRLAHNLLNSFTLVVEGQII